MATRFSHLSSLKDLVFISWWKYGDGKTRVVANLPAIRDFPFLQDIVLGFLVRPRTSTLHYYLYRAQMDFYLFIYFFNTNMEIMIYLSKLPFLSVRINIVWIALGQRPGLEPL